MRNHYYENPHQQSRVLIFLCYFLSPVASTRAITHTLHQLGLLRCRWQDRIGCSHIGFGKWSMKMKEEGRGSREAENCYRSEYLGVERRNKTEELSNCSTIPESLPVPKQRLWHQRCAMLGSKYSGIGWEQLQESTVMLGAPATVTMACHHASHISVAVPSADLLDRSSFLSLLPSIHVCVYGLSHFKYVRPLQTYGL